MAHCSLPFPKLVFCSHIQCVECLHYVDEDCYPLGHEDVLFPSDDCKSFLDIRNEISNRFKVWKETVQFVDSLIKKINSL